MDIPIVLVAFGTTTKALDTYRFMDSIFRTRFKGHRIEWAYSSRMVKDFIKARADISLRGPRDVVSRLYTEGNEWVVVQSLHLICGHEFYRMVDEVREMPVRIAIGLPLLTEPRDYYNVALALRPLTREERDIANVFVGHGTDHPAWTSYMALDTILKKVIGKNTFVGVVEGGPAREDVIGAIRERGYKRVHLVPLMLVAGVHFFEDLAGQGDSWKTSFENEGIAVSVEERGLGYVEGVSDIFVKHIEQAMDAIPQSGAP